MIRPPPRNLSSPSPSKPPPPTPSSVGAGYTLTRLPFTPAQPATALSTMPSQTHASTLQPPPSAGRLAMSHLASPIAATPTATIVRDIKSPIKISSNIATVSSTNGDETFVWSPTRGSSVSVQSPTKEHVNIGMSSIGNSSHRVRSKSRSPRNRFRRSGGNSNVNQTNSSSSSNVGHRTTTTTTTTTTHHTSSSGADSDATLIRTAIRSPTRGVASQSMMNAQLTRATPGTASKPVSSLLDSMSELRSLIAKKEMELSSLAATRPALAHMSASSSASTNASFAVSTFTPLTPNRLASPPRRSPSPLASTLPSAAMVTTFHPATSPSAAAATSASLLAQSTHQLQDAISSHTQSLHDQEIHEYNIRVMSLEQTLLEREEQYQTLKLEVDRLKRREEALSTDAEVRTQAHKKQVEVLNASLESLTWNRHDSLEKQRDEFERLRKDMLDEMTKREEIHNLKIQNMNQSLLQYEEALRQSRLELDDVRDKSKKEVSEASSQISSLTAEVASLQNQKSSVKDQLQSGIKQQLSMSNNLKVLSRKLEETQKKQEQERLEFYNLQSRLETEAQQRRAEYEAKAEELVDNLRGVERQLLENERNYAANLAQKDREKAELQESAQYDRERLMEEYADEKRALIDEFQQKVNDSALALTAAQNHAQHLERDLQEQRQRFQHEAALSTESWNNLVQEKERELQGAKRDLHHAQTQLADAKEHVTELEATITSLRIELVQSQSDLSHARQSLEDGVERLAEARQQHRQLEEEHASQHQTQLEELNQRLAKSQRDHDESQRALQIERLRTNELTAQLQLLRTASQNKVRAIEVARSLEQQALLTDFASQLGRVRSEITAIKSQTPKDKQRELNRTKRERERERQGIEREESRERSRERMRSPQPQSATQAAISMSPTGSVMGSARRHVRVREIDDAPLHTGSQIFGSPRRP